MNFNDFHVTENNESEKLKKTLSSEGLFKVPKTDENKVNKDSSYRRVAKFLLLIGVDSAAKIIPYLTENQVEKIVPEIASIRDIPPEESGEILKEFQSLLNQIQESGGVETAKHILNKAYGEEKAKQIFKKSVPVSDKKVFEYLNDFDSERIYFLLKDETVAVKAIVLSRLNPKKSASVINLMDKTEKTEIIYRLVKLQPISPEVLVRLDKAIHEKSLAQVSEKTDSLDGRNVLAQILKKMSPSQENSILLKLSEQDPDLSKDLKDRLFTMEDILNADERFIQEYLKSYTNVEIAYLIFNKKSDFKEKIFNCISQGRKVQVEDELNFDNQISLENSEKITAKFLKDLQNAYENGKLIIKNRTDEIYV